MTVFIVTDKKQYTKTRVSSHSRFLIELCLSKDVYTLSGFYAFSSFAVGRQNAVR